MASVCNSPVEPGLGVTSVPLSVFRGRDMNLRYHSGDGAPRMRRDVEPSRVWLFVTETPQLQLREMDFPVCC